MKTFLCFTFFFLILPFGITHVQAQCTTYGAGPYGDQAIDIASCDGGSVNAPYAAWANEVYFSTVVAGGNYTFELVGCNATNWGGLVEITVIDGGTDDGAGNITGGTTTVGTGCSITFTAINSGVAYFIVTTVGGCGSAVIQVDNGVPTITTNSGVPCGACGDTVCGPGEDYCNCSSDCDCVGAAGVFVTGLDAGAAAVSPVPVVYCLSSPVFGSTNPVPEQIIIPFAPIGNQPCVTDYSITSDFGVLDAPSVPELNIGLLTLTDADLVASGGMITITFTDATTGNGCTFDLVVDMSTAIVEAGTPWAGTAADACPGFCNENAVCDVDESYCSCATDCACVGANPSFVTGLIAGAPAVGTVPVVYCTEDLGGLNPNPASILIPFVPFGNQPCVTDYTISSDFGALTATTLSDNGVEFVELTDADIAASGGMITITFTDATTGNGCTFDLVIDMSTATEESGAPWAGTAAAACPPTSDCPPEYTAANGNRLIGTETGIADYESDGSIESEQTIDATADVDYDSALDIELLAGFNTVTGAIFDAFIDGCLGAQFTENNEQMLTNALLNKNINRTNSKHLQTITVQKKIPSSE